MDGWIRQPPVKQYFISFVQCDDITVKEEEDEDGEEQPCAALVITRTKAEPAFETCLPWLEQAEATPMNLVLLRELWSLAMKKKINSFYFKKN